MPKIVDTTTHPETGHVIVHYESGAQYDRDAGRLIHPATHAMITAETSPLMQQRRREISEQQARDALDEAAIEAGTMPLTKMGTGEGWYQIVKHTAVIFLKSENVRGLAEMFGKLGQATGNLSTQRVEIENNVNIRANREVAEAATKLLDFLYETGNALEGDVHE
jgi:hypothetical protein